VRRTGIVAALAVAALGTAAFAVATPSGPGNRTSGSPTQYVVVFKSGASKAAARAAIKAAGGRIIRENRDIGVATVVSRNPAFITESAAARSLYGAARNRPVGRVAPITQQKFDPADVSALRRAMRSSRRSSRFGYSHHKSGPEPFAGLQWDMQMIHATTDGSYKKERGSRKVLVGVIDTGIDGNHPDIAPNFNRQLSRNFTTDIPLIDGACANEPDQSCNDPNDVDENSHGTHVASTIGSPINGLGMAGVAPEVTLVNIRAGQDSGYFFLQPSVDALTYAGDHGIDVVNMSYYIDPWLFNCRNNASDSPAEQLEQQTIIEGTQRALDYAHLHGVTLIAAAGNAHTNLAQVTSDDTSPDFPPNTERHRTVDNNCLILPEQGNNVMGVSALGPSKRKADYSNYGYEKITVSAPGGWFRDDFRQGAPTPRVVENLILAAYPATDPRHLLNPDGTPRVPDVVRDCKGSTCAYYQWIQGTSMASPHAVGVAALIVSEYGQRKGTGVSLHPLFTQAYLEASATDTPCQSNQPDGTFSYAFVNRPASYLTFCQGTPVYNGVYGHGIVDALNAVQIGKAIHQQ
jgi:lantibiotic leader peptide-processing serine protease